MDLTNSRTPICYCDHFILQMILCITHLILFTEVGHDNRFSHYNATKYVFKIFFLFYQVELIFQRSCYADVIV